MLFYKVFRDIDQRLGLDINLYDVFLISTIKIPHAINWISRKYY